ncbi:MAG: carbohydrate binding family 9 domain-containing protein [Gemmatimonadaceae bacterium]|nr:carbohydrate binding family 9 domain-containing protein [Gemmatimonadaceae bacterium]
MLITAFGAFALLQGAMPAQPGASRDTWDGSAGQLHVLVPRLTEPAVVDGRLDEPAWSKAARLTGFSQYQPVDGRPAEDSTEVLVWYAPDAIWFGIRAREAHGDVVRATRANRDNIASEDYVQILLDTYNDRRTAFLFGVNPLGMQQDGTRSDQYSGGAGGFSAGGGGIRDINFMDGNTDLNPDYVFESKGRLVPGGYEVEVRIPFKTLRYRDVAVQTWGLHVLRRVQHSGFQDSWAPALRASSSFLGQAGTLGGLHDLQRGLVLDATPTVTARADGGASPDGWRYTNAQEIGADLHWGVRQNMTLNGTVNPDFSQVEADVGQVTLNERFALFYPEKRPFFLDGLELFDTPNQLVYTRRMASPDAGLKLAGKVGGTNIAALVTSDSRSDSWDGRSNPVFGVVRLRQDLGGSSTVGAILTTREEGAQSSRLAGADARIFHSGLYFVGAQYVQSWTDSAGRARDGQLFEALWDRTGRAWGFHYSLKGIAPDFRAAAGFVNRTDIVEASVMNRFTFYGDPGALAQQWGVFTNVSRVTRFTRPGAGAIEGYESISPSATFRGGWRLNGSVGHNFYPYEPGAYASYTSGPGGMAPFAVPGGESDLFSGSIGVTTPTYRAFTATGSVSAGEAPIFREAARGRSVRFDGTLDVRPTAGLRTSVQVTRLALYRERDGSRALYQSIPRLKVEYQLSRSTFVRVVGQYTASREAPLVDRNGFPIRLNGVADAGSESNDFRADWLLSYHPTPGTLFYLGYGAAMTEPGQLAFQDFRRTSAGLFLKLSYLFRL